MPSSSWIAARSINIETLMPVDSSQKYFKALSALRSRCEFLIFLAHALFLVVLLPWHSLGMFLGHHYKHTYQNIKYVLKFWMMSSFTQPCY